MFYHSVFKNILRLKTLGEAAKISRSTAAHFYLLQSPNIRSFCDVAKSSLSVDYLINSCGLSPESASKVSQHITIKTTTRPDSVLALLKSYGFSNPNISMLILRRPSILLANPEKILKPKLDFLVEMGVSEPMLANIVSANPNILARSLERKIIPSLHFLRTLVPTDESFVIVLSRLSWIIHGIQNVLMPKIEILQNCGVPQSSISRLLLQRPRTMTMKNTQFKNIVQRLLEMDFSPKKVVFIQGLSVLSGLTKPVWETKLAVFRRFGWSEEEVLSVFKKQPTVMAGSAEKIELMLDFCTNTMGWTQEVISKFPTVLALSFKKRIEPRCSVIEILISKGLAKGYGGWALLVAEDKFLKKCVSPYKKWAPELLQVYKSKKGLSSRSKHSVSSQHRGEKVEKVLNLS